MSALIEDSPDYADKVTAYLRKNGRRRLNWGALVVGDHLTMTKATAEQLDRRDLGEVAISLLDALGVPALALDAIANRVPWNAPPAAYVEALESLQAVGPDASHPDLGPDAEEPQQGAAT
jgi:hypothetical protein